MQRLNPFSFFKHNPLNLIHKTLLATSFILYTFSPYQAAAPIGALIITAYITIKKSVKK